MHARRWAIVRRWITHRLALLSHKFLFEYSLLCCNSILVVVEEFTTKQKSEFGIVSLLVLRHLFEFWSVSCHELSEFIDDVPQFDI